MDNIVLVVDDDSANLMIAQKILGKEYRMAAANSGAAALKYLEKNRPSLILLDINMPDMNGFETIAELKRHDDYKTIPVIFLTAEVTPETETKCFQAGAVDFVGKPFVADVLLSRVRRTLELERYRNNLEDIIKEQAALIEEKTRHITDMQQHTIMGMANLIESRDGSTGAHVKNMQNYVKLILDKLKSKGLYADILDDAYIDNTLNAAALHDIGKIKIPDAILQKPGRLTPEEFAIMQKHTEYSDSIINDVLGDVTDDQYTDIAKQIAMYHHERWDGNGYPRGLKGEEIPLCARIVAVADVFDALVAERCYKPPIRPMQKVVDILNEGRGTQFDATIIDAFLEMRETLEEMVGI